MKRLLITIIFILFLITNGCSRFTDNDNRVRIYPTAVKASQRTKEEERLYKHVQYRIWAYMIQQHYNTKEWTTEEIMAEIATQEYLLELEKESKPNLSSQLEWNKD